MAAIAAAAVATSPTRAAPPAGRLVSAHGQWAVVRSGAQCDASAMAIVRRRDPLRQAAASVSFTADGRRRGEVSLRLGRAMAPGASVLLTVGERPFLLATRAGAAFATGPAQDRAIIAAMRSAGGMRAEGRDRAGRRFVERFLLGGAPTAIDAAAVACR